MKTITLKSGSLSVKEHQTVAECKKRNHGRGGNRRTRLNKAAPEMLEALELAEATIERVNPKVHNSCGGTLEVIRAAIAKAKGV